MWRRVVVGCRRRLVRNRSGKGEGELPLPVIPAWASGQRGPVATNCTPSVPEVIGVRMQLWPRSGSNTPTPVYVSRSLPGDSGLIGPARPVPASVSAPAIDVTLSMLAMRTMLRLERNTGAEAKNPKLPLLSQQRPRSPKTVCAPAEYLPDASSHPVPSTNRFASVPEHRARPNRVAWNVPDVG